MTKQANDGTAVGPGYGANRWRIVRWAIALLLLFTPLVMMRVSEWNWTAGDFVAAGGVMGGTLLLYELAIRGSADRAYRLGMALALAAGFVMIWATFVHDDGTGMNYFEILLAGLIGTFAVRAKADGMTRIMQGLVVMQALVGLAIATAPMTVHAPGGVFFPLRFAAFFMMLWLMAAACFRKAARNQS